MSVFKFRGDFDEMSYPFIYENSSLCDFEILTDELCTLTGLAGSQCVKYPDIQQKLFDLQPTLFDLNGSVRGRCTIDEPRLEWAKDMLQEIRQSTAQELTQFVLPRGTGPVVPLHACRSLSKKATRALVRVAEEGRAVPDTLPRFCNVLTNLFFAFCVSINEREGVEQPVYISQNYPQPRRSGR